MSGLNLMKQKIKNSLIQGKLLKAFSGFLSRDFIRPGEIRRIYSGSLKKKTANQQHFTQKSCLKMMEN